MKRPSSAVVTTMSCYTVSKKHRNGDDTWFDIPVERPLLYRTISIWNAADECDVDWRWVLYSDTKNANTMYFRYLRNTYPDVRYDDVVIAELNRRKRVYCDSLPVLRRFVRTTRKQRNALIGMKDQAIFNEFIPNSCITDIIYRYITRMRLC